MSKLLQEFIKKVVNPSNVRLGCNSLIPSKFDRSLTMLLMLYFSVKIEGNLCEKKTTCSYITRSCGAMDNASAYGAEDSRFESWQDRYILLLSFYFSSFQDFIGYKKQTLTCRAKMDMFFLR